MIDIETFLDKSKNDSLNIIDIRDGYLYNLGHINGSINIPSYELLGNYKTYLNKNEVYYIYCQYGTSSDIVVRRLKNIGYNVINIMGGYDAYLKVISGH